MIVSPLPLRVKVRPPVMAVFATLLPIVSVLPLTMLLVSATLLADAALLKVPFRLIELSPTNAGVVLLERVTAFVRVRSPPEAKMLPLLSTSVPVPAA